MKKKIIIKYKRVYCKECGYRYNQKKGQLCISCFPPPTTKLVNIICLGCGETFRFWNKIVQTDRKYCTIVCYYQSKNTKACHSKDTLVQ